MLLGQYTSKLTDKYRISVPKKFRKELGEELIIARWYENCLVLISKGNFDNLRFRLTGEKKLVISPIRDIDRFILGSAYEIKLDKQGRFIIPEILMAFAEIESEVTFVGLGDRVEIWSSGKWREMEDRSEEKAKQALEKIAGE
jgi:MraZ protein